MKRRDFIKYGAGGLATLVVGTKMPWLMDNPAYAASLNTTGVINFTITDALKGMVTHNTGYHPDRHLLVLAIYPVLCLDLQMTPGPAARLSRAHYLCHHGRHHQRERDQ